MAAHAVALCHRWVRSLVVMAVVLALALASGAAPGPVSAALPRWTGGIDLYRTGVFTTQATWLWCTAADVQIMRNIVDRQRDHSSLRQQRYFDSMRRHNRYAIPVSDGVDPAGWAAGLRRFVDPRYRLVASGSFRSALRSAVRNLRLANRPVGITVSHGNHAWVLTGFTATADPAVTRRFTVTSVRVVGPLWGLQSRAYGYDMRPDTRLTPSQLRGFFTPWHYAGVRMAWEGAWVSIQPMANTASAIPAPTVTAAATTATAPPSDPSSRPAPTSAATTTSSSVSTSAPDPTLIGLVGAATKPPTTVPTPLIVVSNVRDPGAFDLDAGLAVLLIVIAIAGGTALWLGRRRPTRRDDGPEHGG